MSISFLKPVVTPCTALASSARARPCRARSSSLLRTAVSTPSFCSSLICRGTSTNSLPLGPCTSTLPPVELTFTPEGSGIGLRPIRDMVPLSFSYSLSRCHHGSEFKSKNRSKDRPLQNLNTPASEGGRYDTPLPNLAKNFAANIRLARGAAGHQALRRGEDADAEAADDGLEVGCAEVIALARAVNPLHAGDHAAAVGGVLEEDA